MAQTKARPAGRMINTEINIPTMVRTRLDKGRLLGVDGSVWLARKAPMAPVVDAKSPEDRIQAFIPLMNAYEELATLTPINGNRRALSRRNYRATQVLMVNRAHPYVPPAGDALTPFLKQSFPSEVTEQRFTLLLVRLRDTIGNGGLKEAIDSVVETLVDGGAPLSDYDKDTKAVDDALARHGFTTPTQQELQVADSWWNQGHFPDTVSLSHPDHMHIFADTNAARMAADAGAADCTTWPDIPNARSLTFATLYDFDFPFLNPNDMRASWATPLIDDGTVAISIRALIEPAKVTRDELRRQRKRFLDDINERYKAGKMERSEQLEMEDTLREVESVYASGTGSATLVDTSVLIAIDGEVEDITQIGRGGSSANLRVMSHRQTQSLSEMMMCSPISANPVLNDLPSQSIACSGIQSLNRAGDRTGALVGFTERDRQPVLFDPLASTKEDTGPYSLTVGSTGSGKSQLMLWKVAQYQKMGLNQILIDPKSGSDFGEFVDYIGGTTVSLDELASSDGILDPMRFSENIDIGISLAVSMIAQINPWGGDAGLHEAQLQSALSYGARQGGDCIGVALERAMEKNRINGDVAGPILRLAESHPLFGALIGRFPQGESLRAAKGLTYIKTGTASLALTPGQQSKGIDQRVSQQVVRMLVYGSKAALSGRDGVIHLDEAWVFLSGGRSDMEEFGRTGRSQRVIGELYTQRVSDALNAGLEGYISRGTILPIEDKHEAAAALQLFGMEPTAARMGRVTAKKTIGEDKMPNWSSFHALRDPETRKVLRGTIGIHIDLGGRAIPTQIKLPESFLQMTSTNLLDQRSREAKRASQLIGA
ncbi:ATP-binding protein (plasmid) [Citricoccus nitrophenolicus]